MTSLNKKPKKRENSVTNNNKPELPQAVMQLLKKPCNIIAIVCAGNYVDFFLKDDTCVSPRLLFKDLLPWLCPAIFMQIHRCWVINMHYMVEENHDKNEWWIKLTNHQRYSVSEPFYEIFLDNLNYMTKFKRVRERFERTRHRKLFSSKFDV
jgi:hypothetical protein